MVPEKDIVAVVMEWLVVSHCLQQPGGGGKVAPQPSHFPVAAAPRNSGPGVLGYAPAAPFGSSMYGQRGATAQQHMQQAQLQAQQAQVWSACWRQTRVSQLYRILHPCRLSIRHLMHTADTLVTFLQARAKERTSQQYGGSYQPPNKSRRL